MEETFYQFDEDFENLLVARLIRNKAFFYKVHRFIRVDYLTFPKGREIFKILSDYYEKYHDSITIEILKNSIKELLNSRAKKSDEDLTDYMAAIDTLMALDISKGEDYTAEQVIKFSKRCEMKAAMDNVYKIIDKPDFDLNKFLAKAHEINAFGANLDMGYDYFADTIQRTSRIYEPIENKVSTGFRSLNISLDGGLSPGELAVVVAPSSRGKTAFLVNIAIGALLNRKNVIYFGFEGSLEELCMRFDMRISRCTKEDLYKQTEKVRDDVFEFVKYLHKGIGDNRIQNQLIIKMFPAETVTVADLDNFLNYIELATKFVPDLIIIDPLYLCKPSNTRIDTWRGSNYSEGKALADFRKKPVWTSTQAKLDAKENDVIMPSDISEATVRIWSVSDIIVGLCQTTEEKTKIPQEMRLYLGKNRNKQAHRVVPVKFQTELMLMEEITL